MYILLALILFFIFLFINSMNISKQTISDSGSTITSSQGDMIIKNYMETCIANDMNDYMDLLGQSGGYVTIPDEVPYLHANGNIIPYWVYNELYTVDIEMVRDELDNYLHKTAVRCSEDQNITGDINFGRIITDVDIRDDSIKYSVDMGLNVLTENKIEKLPAFEVIVESKIKNIIVDAAQISSSVFEDNSILLSTESDFNVYDIDESDKVIKIIDDDYIFQFAVNLDKITLNNSAPVLQSVIPVTARLGDLVQVPLIAEDFDNDNLSYSVNPPNHAIVNNTLNFIAVEPGTTNLMVTVTDDYGESDSQYIRIIVQQ